MKFQHNKQYNKFLILWVGQFFSMIGSGLTSFALGIYVFQKTGSVTSFTMLLLCIFLPSVLIKPFGGVLADRFDRRLLMFFGDFGASLGTVFILILMHYLPSGLWFIYLGIIVSSISGSFQEPAYKATITDLLPKELYDKASGLMQLASSSQYLISPFIAGILLSFFNIKFIFMIDILTFILAVITTLWVRKSIGNIDLKRKTSKLLNDFKEGINELLNQKGVLWLVLITMFVLFFVGLLQSLLVPMLLSLTDAKFTGIIQSITAAGMIAGSLFIGIFGSKKKYVKMLSMSLFFTGVFFSLIGVNTNLIFITIVGFLFFSFLPFVNTSIEVLIRNNIDNEKQGRIWSIISTITYFGSIIAFLVAGFLADKIFNPLLQPGGLLALSIGKIIGIGETRGIGLIFIIAGIFISFISMIIFKNKYVRKLEFNNNQEILEKDLNF